MLSTDFARVFTIYIIFMSAFIPGTVNSSFSVSIHQVVACHFNALLCHVSSYHKDYEKVLTAFERVTAQNKQKSPQNFIQ
jgi:hypothetical protein